MTIITQNKKKFIFDERNHVYTLDGKRLTGVTTILNMIGGPKTNALMQWAVNCNNKEIEQVVKGQKTVSVSKLKNMLNDTKYAHKKARDKAGDIGHLIHSEIEEYYQRGTQPKTQIAQNAIDWMNENTKKVHYSEIRLFNVPLWYAGTVDAIAEDNNGNFWVLDFKTSSGVRDRGYFAQCAAYQMAYEYMVEHEPEYNHMKLPNGKKFVGHAIIHINKKNGKIKPYLSTETGKNKRVFMAALDLYRNIEI